MTERMGENEFGFAQSILEFECSLEYRGNKRPVFCWSLNDDLMPGTSILSLAADSNSTTALKGLFRFVSQKKLISTIVHVKAVIDTDTGSDQCSFNSTNVHWESEPLEIKCKNRHKSELF